MRQLVTTDPRDLAAASQALFGWSAGQRASRLREAATVAALEQVRPRRERMRALVAGQDGRLAWRRVLAPPPPGPLGATVHPIAMATCDLDRALVLGRTPFPRPLQLGHECVAEVVAVGSRVRTVRVGDRVVVPFEISCGECGACRTGLTGSCRAVPPASMYGFGLAGGHWGGAYADLVGVPFADAMLVPLPEGVPPAAAASLADTVCDGFRHVAPHLPRLLERDPDAEVLIIGALPARYPFSVSTALYAGLTARSMGARRVTFCDARGQVREEAARLGLEAIRPAELRRRDLAPLVVDISGSPRGMRTALAKTAPDGVCSSVGTLRHSARIPASLLFIRNVTLHIGRAHTRTLIPRVLELVTTGALRPETVTTRLADLDDAPEVLTDHMATDATKTVLTTG
ncbi:zinc-dependent alcohol dehydrogenase [Actinocorallia herbida]|uniref:zinc-dependent alcohol dehydrogenase n=1 Tax=Actinocorallia herbida TaxID=58109 RepID=UPI001476A04F|nr:alcohol dehydrogenase catalytic domain-containing protein [Actinocorallia herbida]